MPWKPDFPGERPTLGHYAISWIEAHLAMPDQTFYSPYLLTKEMAELVLHFYELDPITGRRINRRCLLCRSRGWGKSPFAACLCWLEGLADVVPDGWDASGRPVGKPWAAVRRPLVQIAAVSDEQVLTNTWAPLLEMANSDAPLHDAYPGIEPMTSRVNLPYGAIQAITASGATAKGAPAVFMVWDQTEEWTASNGGVGLAKRLADNVAKTGGSYIETPNAYVPVGEQGASVAQRSAEAYALMQEGRTRMKNGILYDHRYAPNDIDITDYDSLVRGLRLSYGDSSGHPDGCLIHDPPCEPGFVDLDSIVARVWDPDNDEANAVANFLSQITGAQDAFLHKNEWDATTTPEPEELLPGDVITLGMDGSRGRAKGKPDATALVACRVRDGHLFELLVLEADDTDRSTWNEWSPDIPQLEAEIKRAFDTYTVAAFYADPGSDWRSYVNKWEGEYGDKVKHKAKRDHPFEWWMTGGRATVVEQAVEQFESAVRLLEVHHNGGGRLTAHMLQARRRLSHGKLALGKESRDSSYKIDAAVAAILAWQARLDVVAANAIQPDREPRVYTVRRRHGSRRRTAA